MFENDDQPGESGGRYQSTAHEMTREEFHRTAWAHGAKRHFAEMIEAEGFKRGEFAPPEQIGRGISFAWDKSGLNALEVLRMKEKGRIPRARHGFVYFARRVNEGETPDLPHFPLKMIGRLPYAAAAKDPHRAFVELAIAAGKTIPPQVLADYPELTPVSAHDDRHVLISVNPQPSPGQPAR